VGVQSMCLPAFVHLCTPVAPYSPT
jgi:hypothetical protein